MILSLLIKIFFVAFFINLFYELLHSVLYATCIEAPLKRYVYLILKGAVFDGFVIAILYGISYVISPRYYLLIFFIISLVFAYIWEVHALKTGKWKYANTMPVIFGVGITPLIQLACTGILSICIVLKFFIQ